MAKITLKGNAINSIGNLPENGVKAPDFKLVANDLSEKSLADFEGKIVSVVVSRRDLEYNRYFKAKRGYLGPAGTLPEFRGKGLASALTRRAMNFLYEKGMDSVALYTSENNAASIALLRKLGFKIRHNWKFLYKYK